jgi:hypothetical protein
MFPTISLTEVNMDNRQTAIEALLSELQKGENSAKKKGYIDISDVEKILKAN